ncbi:MAG: hypothetical protein WBW14_29715 [Candidatus Acidiferrum sp.]
MIILKGLTLVAALFAGGTLAMAQDGLPTGNKRPVHHRLTHVHPAIYNMVIPAAAGGSCTASGGPACSSACTGSGPCAPPDSW